MKMTEKQQKLQSAIERLGKERPRMKHSRGDVLKVIKANKGSGKLKIPKFLTSEK